MSHFLSELDENVSFDRSTAYQAVMRLTEQVAAASRDLNGGAPGIVGQEQLVRRLISAFIIGEHCLLEGLPGLVKTKLSKTLGTMLGLIYARVQFTPDMMPSDLIGRERFRLVDGMAEVEWVPGPIFANLLLADEINRASSKVQSALLEATEERQATTMYQGRLTIRPKQPVDEAKLLGELGPFFGEPAIEVDGFAGQHFMVLATMNPIEQEGVFPLSEAQLDRFAYKLIVEYPPATHLSAISEHAFEHDGGARYPHDEKEHVKTLYFLMRLRRMLLGPEANRHWLSMENASLRSKVEALINFTHVRPIVEHGAEDESSYGVTSAFRTESSKQRELRAILKRWEGSRDEKEAARATRMIARARDAAYPEVLSGASPRGLLKLIRAAHVEAFMNGRDAPTWEDVCNVTSDVLRHRIRLSTGALATGATPERLSDDLLRWLSD